jgi:hypothetical protein
MYNYDPALLFPLIGKVQVLFKSYQHALASWTGSAPSHQATLSGTVRPLVSSGL